MLFKYTIIYQIINKMIYKTAIDYAKEENHQEIVDLLSNAQNNKT